jgi:hypothetical protein
MCNPSSSAEQGRHGDFAGLRWAGQSHHEVIAQAYAIGPATVCFIEQLWRQAAQEAYWQSLEVFQFARWYSPQRLERAVNRILDRAIGGSALLRFVLEEELDLLEHRPDADLRGQLVFPFMGSRFSEVDRQIGNRDIYAGFSWTSSRESW